MSAERCSEVQVNLSLFLYGELDFAAEEAVEHHLSECPMCQLALAREKRWHTTLNSESRDLPDGLLAACRSNLRDSIQQKSSSTSIPRPLHNWWANWTPRATQWSGRVAFASFFLFAGMMVSRWSGHVLPGAPVFGQMSLVGGANASHVRDIQPDAEGRVHIIVDRLEQREIVGSAADASIQQLLMAATRNSPDPGLRIDSLDLLRKEHGDDIRDALLFCVRHDGNAAVRLKAIDSLSRYAAEPPTRQALVYALEHDMDSGVRSRAIDVLLPPHAKVQIGPDLLRALEGVSQSNAENDYLRARSLQILQAVDAFTADTVY